MNRRMRLGRLVLLAVVGVALTWAGWADSPRDRTLRRLREVADSKSYYWAWTHPWLDVWKSSGDASHAVKGPDGKMVPRATGDVRLVCGYQKYADGKRTLLAYSDLAGLVGTWHSPQYYERNRASLTAAIRRYWRELGGVMVFSWHMDQPYCTNGFRQASYRFKSTGADRNVIRQILDGTGGPCGTDTLERKDHRPPCANPREWYMRQLQDVAAFFKGLVDEETGERIPVILRYGHEMDGSWFWWGRTWCTADEFRRFSRMTADYLRRECGDGQILFAYTPDRTWSDFGREGDSDNTFLAYYPGDKYVDILGLDDYSIGQGNDAKAEQSFAETLRKLRLMTAFAEAHGKVAAISETGGLKKRDDFWQYVYRLMTADGVKLAFVDTWSGCYGTIPDTPASEQDELAFARRPETLMEGSGKGFREVAAVTSPLCDYAPNPKLHLRDNQTWRPAPKLGNALTVEYVFVPRDVALLPPGKSTGYGRSLLNVGSGYYSGFRLIAVSGMAGLMSPSFSVGRPKGGSVNVRGNGLFVPDVTNQLIVTWNGKAAQFTLNGRPAGGGACEAAWTPPENDFLGVGYNNYGIDALPQNAVRVRIWNRVLTDAEIAAENIYRNRPLPPEMKLQDILSTAIDGVTLDGQTSAELERLTAGVKIPPALKGVYERLLADLRLREGKVSWGEDAFADDDGRPRHRPVPPAPTPGRALFVAPDGDDAAAGTEAAPLKTLTAARDRVRAIRKAGLPAGGVAVCLRGGTYPMTETLALTDEDSGEPGKPVVWTAWRGERPVLDGGFRVTGFAVATAADALARLPQAAHGKVLVADVKAAGYDALAPQSPYGDGARGSDQRITDLYFNGRPLSLARQPNDGWYTVGTCSDVTSHEFAPVGVGDLGRWAKTREPELMAFGYWKYFWADVTVEVDAVDVAKGTVRIRDRGTYTPPKTGQTFRFVNALAALDEPGEWFLDRKAGRLYVYPAAAEGTYVLSRFGEAFIDLAKAHDVRIEGLTLQYGRRHGVTMANCSGVTFAGNVVRRFGGTGVLAPNLRESLFVGNVLHTFGHTALDTSSGNRRTLTPGGLVIANNEIWETGRAQRTYTPGIRANGVGIEILHNHIHDIPSSAIMPGGNDHYVGWNLVERAVTESDDQGGIDMWGDPTWAGTRMCWNIWRDIGGAGYGTFPAGRAGIRLDDAISGMMIYGNRFENSSKGHFGGVQIHAGRFNRVENNLFAGGVCGVSFGVWSPDRWDWYFQRDDVRVWLYKNVNAAVEPYAGHYPHLAALATAPMTNLVWRNVFAEVGSTFRNAPPATDIRGNVKVASAAAAEAAFGRLAHLRPLPPAGEIGTYPDPALDRARRSDRMD